MYKKLMTMGLLVALSSGIYPLQCLSNVGIVNPETLQLGVQQELWQRLCHNPFAQEIATLQAHLAMLDKNAQKEYLSYRLNTAIDKLNTERSPEECETNASGMLKFQSIIETLLKLAATLHVFTQYATEQLTNSERLLFFAHNQTSITRCNTFILNHEESLQEYNGIKGMSIGAINTAVCACLSFGASAVDILQISKKIISGRGVDLGTMLVTGLHLLSGEAFAMGSVNYQRRYERQKLLALAYVQFKQALQKAESIIR